MRIATAALVFAAASCATAPQGKHILQRQALAQIEPAERDHLFGRALSTLQRRGWIIAVSDRAGGLLTTQEMATGAKTCGTNTCDSSSTLQVAITETVLSVNLHREFINPDTGTRFAPTLEQDVVPIEAEQKAILDEILSGPRAGPVPAPPGIGAKNCCKVCTIGKACGDTCISRQYTCHVGPGCACDANP
jgi:hypothetical protein